MEQSELSHGKGVAQDSKHANAASQKISTRREKGLMSESVRKAESKLLKRIYCTFGSLASKQPRTQLNVWATRRKFGDWRPLWQIQVIATNLKKLYESGSAARGGPSLRTCDISLDNWPHWELHILATQQWEASQFQLYSSTFKGASVPPSTLGAVFYSTVASVGSPFVSKKLLLSGHCNDSALNLLFVCFVLRKWGA